MPGVQIMNTSFRIFAWFACLLSISFFENDVQAQTTYFSKALATDFSDVNSWGIAPDGSGTTPGSISNADIFVIGNGANMTLTAPASVRALYIGSDSSYTAAGKAGTLTITSGDTLTVSRLTGNNATLSIGDSGTLNVYGGYLLLNGNFRQTAGTFSQQGGLIAVDGNSGISPTSVPATTAIFDVSNGAFNLSAGTLVLVDPPLASNATNAIQIAVAGSATGNHTLQLGDGISSDSSGSTNGMTLFCYTYKFQNVTVNNNVSASNNRSASMGYELSVLGDLTIFPGAEFRNLSNRYLKLSGNLTNHGKLVTGPNAFLMFEGVSGQTISGNGDFSNSTTSPTANFGSISFANRSAAGVTFSGKGWHSLPSTVSTSLNFNSGDSTMLNRINIGNDTFTLGTSLNPGILVHYYQGGFTGGTFRRWMPTAYFTISTTTGRFPFISAASVSKNHSRDLSISLSGLRNSGIFSVSFFDSAGMNPATPFNDNGAIIEKVSKTFWKVSHLFDTGSSGSDLDIRIKGDGLISTQIYQGMRITGATGSILSVGQIDVGTGGPISPEGNKTDTKVSNLSAIPVSLYLGMDSVIQTAQSGPWQSGSTWVGGIVPGCRVAAINKGHNISVNSGSSSARDLHILASGQLRIGGGSLQIGCDTLRNHQLQNSGSLQVDSGTLTVNGKILNLPGITFIQTGGSIIIDPSDHGKPASSASGSVLVFQSGGTTSLSGGNITIVDPPINGYSVSSSTAAFPASGNHTFIFGNGVSADTNANLNGFIILGGSSTMPMQNVIVNGPYKRSRTVSFSNEFGILGSLTINSGGSLKLPAGSGLSVGGNVTVNAAGQLDGAGANTLAMQRYIGGVASPSGKSQTIGGAGNFYNNANSITANFYSLKINCGNANYVSIDPLNTIGSNPAGASISSGLSLKSGKLRMSSGILIKGTQASGAGPVVDQTPGSGISVGTRYAIWYSASETGSSINAGVDPTSTFKYPFVSFIDSADRSFYIERNSPTAGGLIGVSYGHQQTKELDTTIYMDGSYFLNREIKSSWSVSVLAGNPAASSFEIAAVSPNTYVSINGADNRLVSYWGPVGSHQSGTGTPCAQRGGLSLTDLTSVPFRIGTDSGNILGAPSVAQQPANDTVCLGTGASFSVLATNAASYQWQKNTATGWVNLSNGTGFSGVDTSTMSIAAADTSMEGNQFRCITRNAADSTISGAASLHVILPPTPTIFASLEPNPSPCVGHPKMFTAAVTNAGTNPFFQWKINGVDMGVNDDTLVALSPKNLDTVIALVVSNAVCAQPDTISSAPILLHLQPVVSPIVTIDTPSGLICRGTLVALNASSTDGGSASYYRWFVNGAQVGTGDTLKTTTLRNHDTVSCVLMSNAICVTSAFDTSNKVVIRVDSIPSKPSAITGPGLVCSGATYTFSVPVVSGATSYNWMLPSGWGGTSDSSSIAANPTATGGIISVTAENACGASAADTFAITANATVVPTVSISAPGGNSICVGTPVFFRAIATDTGATPTYIWRRNGVVDGSGVAYTRSFLNHGDSITVSMTSSHSCASPQTIRSAAEYMTVNPVPVLSPISGNIAACMGNTVQLSNPTTGGVWTNSDPTILSVSSTGKVTGISAGTDTIRYTVTNASGCSASVIHFVSFNALPSLPPITGNNSVCVGATTTLSNIASGGVWSGSNSSIATVNSTGQVTGVAAGMDTIVYTLTTSQGCKSAVQFIITVKPLPVMPAAITGNGSVCSGRSEIYRIAPDTNISSYVWTLPSGWSGSSTVDSIVATTGTGSGTISVAAINSCGTSAPSTFAVTTTVTTTPTVSISAVGGNTICAGTLVNFSYAAADSGSAPSFDWRLNGASVATTTTYSNSSLTNGDSITLTITSSRGCVSSQSVSSTALYMTVNVLPSAPSATTSVSYCENAAAIQLTATGTNLKWYTTATGGTAGTIAPAPVTSSPGTTDYWVSQTNAVGCEGPRTQIAVIVNATPPKPTTSGTTPVCVGDTVFLSGSSSASTPVYNWTGPNGFSSTAQNPFTAPATAASAGIYRLAINVGGCISAYDSVVIAVSCLDSVWPGDVNYDKLVDNTDALEIALAMGSTGPTRSPASILWQPEHCSDWSTMLPSNSSINGKHADCDGDGIVGYSDTLAVSANYGLTHPRGIRNTRKQTAGLPALYFDMTGISPNAGGTITVPIMLGDAATPVQGIAGLAARLMIGGVVPSDTPTITYAGSWLGGSANTLQFAKAVSNNRVDWAYARTDQQNNGGNGVLGWMTFTLPPGANGQQLNLYFDEVLIVDSAGAEFTEYNTEEDSVVVLPPLAVSTGVRLQAGLHVLPNPSSGPCVVQLTLPKAGAYTIEVHDLSGRLIWKTSGKGIAGIQKISLPTEDISSGIYLINLRSEVGVASPVRWIKN